MNKYIAYYRVSKLSVSGKERKERGESSLGIEAQKFIVRNYYEKDIVEEHEEIASAKDMNRPVLQKVIALCLEKGYTLVVARLDRLSRRTEDGLEIYEKLNHNMVSCDLPDCNKFTLTLFFALAEREREIIRLRVKSALSRRIAEKGHWYDKKKADPSFLNGTIAARGRKANSAKAKSNPNNIRAAQMIAAWRKAGVSWDSVVQKLNENQFSTSRGMKFSSPVQAIRALQIITK